jgi:translation elongation factor EF-G
VSSQPISCVVSVPESFLGEVGGRLSACGAHLDDIARADGRVTIQARIPSLEVRGFRAWLAGATKGIGSIEER